MSLTHSVDYSVKLEGSEHLMPDNFSSKSTMITIHCLFRV